MPLITAEQLNQLLNPQLWPRIDSVQQHDDILRVNMFVPGDLDYFAGHFPEQAVLPGVVQVHWAGELAKLLFKVDGFSELKSVKFNSMILPTQIVCLELKHNADKATLRFSYQDQEDKFSAGMLGFAPLANREKSEAAQ